MEELDIYVQIASYITPVIATILGFLAKNHFDLKERLRVLEVELMQNQKADDAREVNNEKIWSAINEINSTLKNLEMDVRVLSEKFTK